MRSRNEVIFKWMLYAGAALLFFLLQTSLLQRITLWSVIPFLYPLLVSIPAMYERPVPAAIFALGIGVVCDLALPGPIPCFHTLIFPLIGLCSAWIALRFSAGFACALIVCAVSFLMTDLFHCLLLFLNGQAAWGAGFSVMAREFLVTLPLVIPVFLLFRAVARRVHFDD